MCTVCGCGEGDKRLEGDEHSHVHRHEDGTEHSHSHVHDGGHAHSHEHPHAEGAVHLHGDEHAHVHEGAGHLHFGEGPAGAHAPGLSQSRMVQIEQDILSKNNEYAAANRRYFQDNGIFAINLVSSPGSGKTTLLAHTINALKSRCRISVVEGDQQTSNDAERIRATGAPAVQINTGKGCHLDAHMVGHAVERLKPVPNSMVMLENVGNLVCPAAFDLGEAHKVVILSVTEGEDKPLKYPDMFDAADVMLLNKVDLLPYLNFNVPLCIEYARRINPHIRVILTSSFNGEGMGEWLEWLEDGLKTTINRRHQTMDAMRRRIAELEAELAAIKQV